jgi:energy-coupling factor transport system permease protein
MDARGFDSGLVRTYARRQVFGGLDLALVIGAAVLSAGALTVSILFGVFRPILG